MGWAFPLHMGGVDRSRGYPRGMSPTDIEEEIRQALEGSEEAGEPPEPARAPAPGRWWASPDWWLAPPPLRRSGAWSGRC